MESKSKHTLLSIAVVASVAIVSIALLALINSILPRAKMDQATKDIISQFMIADDYDIYEGEISEYSGVSDFNSKEGTSDIFVLNIYIAKGGEHDGNYIIETSSQGYSDALIILTGYNADSTIIGTRLKSGKETASNGQAYEKEGFYPSFVGKGSDINASDIMSESGATASFTTRAYVNGVNLATKLAMALRNIVQIPETQDPTASELALLQTIYNSESYKKANKDYLVYNNIISNSDADNLVAVYIANDNTVIYEGFGNGGRYGSISLMMIFGDDKISNVIVGTLDSHDNDLEEGADSDSVINSALKQFVGKAREDIDAMVKDDLDSSSGATQTANGILEAARNTFSLYDNISIDKLL